MFLKQLFTACGKYARPEDGEEVSINWVRGRTPVFQLLQKPGEKILKEVALDKLTIVDIHSLLVKHGFQPRRPATDIAVRFVSDSGDSHRGKRLAQASDASAFLKRLQPGGSGYVRRADGERATVEWKASEPPRLDLIDKASGKVLEAVRIDRLGLREIEGVLRVLEFEPAGKEQQKG